MIVTGITEISKSRVKIEIDHEFAFVLYKGELRLYKIEVGKQIEDADFCKLKEEVLPKRAKLRAMNLLKSRAYTRMQLKDKLIQGGYPEDIANLAIDYVTSYGYVDDEQFAKDFIEYNREKKSKKRICMDLMQKGISEQFFQNAWDSVVGENSNEMEKEQILYWMGKKHFQPQNATFEEKQKMMAFLYRKGFSINNIRNVLSLDITHI